MVKNKKKVCNISDFIFMVFVGLFYFAWMTHLLQSWAPDEYMRDDVIYWIVQKGRLPIGNEEELINPIWGHSYAFRPYLTSIIASVLVKIVSYFTTNEVFYVLTFRMVSVFSGILTAFFALKIGKRIFVNRISDYIFAGFICLLPQFAFLCTYFNNDSFSILTVVVIFYFVISVIQDGWNMKNSIGLGAGLGLCALSYYNAYAYILCGILFCFYSWIKNKDKRKEILRYVFIAAGVAFLIAGWYFIRNMVLYQGDILGLKTQNMYSEMYAIDEYKPSNRPTFYNQGKTVWDLLGDGIWIRSLIKTFIGVFGYVDISIPNVIIVIYYLVFIFGGVIGLIALMKKKNTRLAAVTLLITIIIPFLLTLFYSYMNDYQPQGRYCISALPGIAFLAAYGYEKISQKQEEKKKNIILYFISGLWLFLFGIVLITTIFPQCWCWDTRQIMN